MLSHMRGHVVDMEALMAICNASNVQVIEDCAHTMGASWDGVPSGRHGVAGCYSTQTFKHLNSGEGGLLVTDDAEIAARAIMLSGSYMLFERNGAAPDKEVFSQIKLETPNCSGRMDNLRAAILRPQLRKLDEQCVAWNERYLRVEAGLKNATGIKVIERPEKEAYVMSSFQFLCPELSDAQMKSVLKRTADRGVELKWFGADSPVGFTSRHDSWTYVDSQDLPQTDRVLAGLLDMRLPLTFTLEDCDLLATIIREEVGAVYQAG
jgi:dTDP-4-amino-4,6-dideoxygalactose transaminase